ncbi:hypothetical protein GCM10010498_15140 [Streptomyces cavourensis]|nr:hypothetical protein GCM10010498_15140 [Streptomyces cavourensis]
MEPWQGQATYGMTAVRRYDRTPRRRPRKSLQDLAVRPAVEARHKGPHDTARQSATGAHDGPAAGRPPRDAAQWAIRHGPGTVH